jgi:hypothetical protein
MPTPELSFATPTELKRPPSRSTHVAASALLLEEGEHAVRWGGQRSGGPGGHRAYSTSARPPRESRCHSRIVEVIASEVIDVNDWFRVVVITSTMRVNAAVHRGTGIDALKIESVHAETCSAVVIFVSRSVDAA